MGNAAKASSKQIWMGEGYSQCNGGFLKNYNEESDGGHFLEVDVQYPEKIYEIHSDLPFLPEQKKLKKVKRLVTNLHDKQECYTYKKFKTGIMD